MEEKCIFDHGGIKITSARFVAPKQTFAMAGITSVKVEKRNAAPYFAVAFILGGLIMLAGGKQNIWVITAPVIIGIFLLFVKTSYHVVVGSTSGETSALNSKDKRFVKAVVESLNKAMVARG